MSLRNRGTSRRSGCACTDAAEVSAQNQTWTCLQAPCCSNERERSPVPSRNWVTPFVLGDFSQSGRQHRTIVHKSKCLCRALGARSTCSQLGVSSGSLAKATGSVVISWWPVYSSYGRSCKENCPTQKLWQAISHSFFYQKFINDPSLSF